MSTNSAEFGNGEQAPALSGDNSVQQYLDEVHDAQVERASLYGRVIETGESEQPDKPEPGTQASPITATAPRGRSRSSRPRLKEFTGISTESEDIFDPDEPIPDNPEADRIARQERVKAMIEETRSKLRPSSGSRQVTVFRYSPPVQPAELAEHGLVTSYRDSHGYDVVTLSDPRDPNQRYDPNR